LGKLFRTGFLNKLLEFIGKNKINDIIIVSNFNKDIESNNIKKFLR